MSMSACEMAKFIDMPNKVPVNGGNIPIRKVYIPNACGLEKYELKQIFRNFGEIHDIYKPRQCGNFAFITYKNTEDAGKLIKTKVVFHYGKRLYVHPADQWHQPIELPDGTMLWKRDTELKSENGVIQISDSMPSCLMDTLLNDDCLRQVFKYLSLKELIGIERVCKRWRAVGLGIWHSLQTLEFKKTFPMPNTTLYTEYFRELLLRSGSSITTLDVTHKLDDLNHYRVLKLIAKHCHNLTSLNISGISIKQFGMNTLVDKAFGNLKCLYMNGCRTLTFDMLTHICEKAVKLEDLSLVYCSYVLTTKGIVELKLPATLTFLDLTCVIISERDVITRSLQQLKNLKTLHANGRLSFKTFCYFGPTLVTLKTSNIYKLGSIRRPKTDNSDGPIFPVLTALQLKYSRNMDDKFLDDMVRECPALEKLDLTQCSTSRITTRGLYHLTKLKKLTELNLNFSEVVTSDFVSYLAANTNGRLCSLSFMACFRLDDNGPLQLLSLCNELSFLDLRLNRSISNAVLVAAIKCLKLRTNKMPLKLLVKETRISRQTVFERLPLLDLDIDEDLPDNAMADYNQP